MELYAVKYGENFKYANYKTIFHDNKSDDIVPGFVFLYYIAKYQDKTLLFDTGFRGEETAEYYGVNLINVDEEIKAIICDNKVDVIFITHSHFDHTDNLDLYPNAEIIISQAEYDTAVNNYDGSIKKILTSDKLKVVQEEYLYENKFLYKIIGGHTKGSSVIYFEEDDQHYVIAGDECYLIENIDKNIPNGNTYDHKKNADFIADTNTKKLITLPCHDRKILQDYRMISTNVVRII